MATQEDLINSNMRCIEIMDGASASARGGHDKQ